MNSRNLTFHQEYSIIFSGGVFGNHVLGFQTYFEFANCQKYPGIVVKMQINLLLSKKLSKKFQRLGIPFNHIRSSWFAFVQRIIPMFSTNKHIFFTEIAFVREIWHFSIFGSCNCFAIFSNYDCTSKFFQKESSLNEFARAKNRKRKVKSKQKFPPLQLQIWLAEIFPPTFLLA